jgi:plastocyanin
MTRLLTLATLFAASVLLTAAGGGATPATGELQARVGPGFTISLTTDAGARITKLDPGTYTIQVEDESSEHSFHLFGPGVDRSTGIGGEAKETWTVTFKDGIYTFLCDAHSSSMKGSFTVGSGSSPSTGGPPAITAKTRLVLTTGPGFSITLKTKAGTAVKVLKTGTYGVTVRDRSSMHNAHVVAPGYNRKTTVPFVGTQTWKVKLAKAGTLRFLCDPHASSGMRGSAKIVR